MDLLDPNLNRKEILLESWKFSGQGNVTFREHCYIASDSYQLNNVLGEQVSSNDPDVGALSAELTRLRACAGDICPK